jgi:aminopeptidase
MEMNQLEKYARLLVQTGINVQDNQTLVVNCPVECAYFARVIATEAYAVGARKVVINWRDDLVSRITLLNAKDDIFDEFPEWQKAFYNDLANEGAAFLSISASDPEVFKGVDPERMARQNKASSTAIAAYRSRMMSNKNAWCVASIPTESWAVKVFPGVTTEVAVEKLWDAIFKSVRVDQADPVVAWNEHKANLQRRLKMLNDFNFKSMTYKNSLGTDFNVALVEEHIWLGGSEYTPEGVEFIANMPTEEVFTAPAKIGSNGKVVSSMPLNYNGNLIDNFSLTFENGKIVDFTAEQGYDVLKGLLDTDEGARHIGEVALVPYDSPISNLKTLFFNTLYDENASCHFAFGKAYPVNVEGGKDATNDELAAKGINDSLTHVDFMIGTKDLSIVGIQADGTQVVVFENGNFVF